MSNSELQATKIELAQFILGSKNLNLIEKIQAIVRSETKDFWLELSDEEKKEVATSRSQIENGETEDWDSLKLRLGER